jgi:DmsE family decaheme c-type cytochrome
MTSIKAARLVLALVPALMYGLGAAPCSAEAPAVAGPDAAGESQTCLECHDDQGAGLVGGPHAVLTAAPESAATRVSCTHCHGGVAAHWQDDPSANPMSVPGRDGAIAGSTVCNACHLSSHQENQQTLSQHAAAGVDCVDCHQVHGAKFDRQLKNSQPQLCYGCHAGQQADFAKPFRHAVGEGIINCSDCHLATDDNLAPLAGNGRNAACFQCHGELQGPFPFEHQATVDWSTESGGCVTCHDPHGSYLPRLLNQPYEAPHFQLCSQCHIVPKHNFNTQHGTDWAGVGCAECHVDIHGSYTSRLFLSPTLASQGCFVAGCHTP